MINRILILSTLLFSILLISCNEENPEPEIESRYENGVFVVNEGNFSDSDGTMSYYDLDSGIVTEQVFEKVNERPLAAIFQSLAFYDGQGYIIDQNGRIEVVLGHDLTSLHSISTNLEIPRYFAGYENKGFVSDWGPYDENYNSNESRVLVYDLTAMNLQDEIETTSRPEDMVIVQDKLYVANSGTNIVSVYDPSDNSLITEVEVSYGPTRFVRDKNNDLWVICTGAYVSTGALVGIKTSADEVLYSLDLTEYPPNGRLAINGEGDEVYFMSERFSDDFTTTENTVYRVSLSIDAIEPGFANQPEEVVSGTNWYGLGVDPVNEVLYVADAAAFQSNGSVYRFDRNGEKIDEFNVGRGPRDFVFINN